MGSSQLPKLTATLLLFLSEAALQNAEELCAEATILRDHDHIARAYFLAVGCIEEVGKALLTFDSQTRNLADPAVRKKLKTSMENHGQKITYALSMWALNSPDRGEALKVAIDLSIDVKHGREPSMYSDLRSAPDRAQSPRQVVCEGTARDCVRLAENCLAYAHRHMIEKTPPDFTVAQDRLFTMKSGWFQKTVNREGFWWYYISKVEAGQPEFAQAVLGYENDHVKTDTPFRVAQVMS